MKVDPTYHSVLIKRQPQTFEYKQYRKRYYEVAEKDIVTTFPIHLDLELNTTCNLSCPFCIREYFPPAPALMPLELAIRVIDEAVREGTLSMKFQCRGEPLLHPFIVEIVDYAKKSGIIEVMFNSNCTLLTPEMSLHLINAGLDKIICSVDTHDPYYYAKLRKGGNLDQTYRNINNLRQIRDKLGSKTPYIRIQMIDMKETHDMLPDTIKFWEPIADEISVVDFLDFHRIEHAEPVPNWCCNQPWQRLLVLADGNVIPCTGLYCDEKVVGNIYERSLKEIWNSREMRFIRECHRNGKSHLLEMCRICPLRRRYIE